MQPITAVASSISSSGTSTRWLSSPNRFSSRAPASPSARLERRVADHAALDLGVIVGITRTTGAPGNSSRNRATGVAASTEAIASPAPPSCSAAVSSAAGFTASTHGVGLQRELGQRVDRLAAELLRQLRRPAGAGVAEQHRLGPALGLGPAPRQRRRHVPRARETRSSCPQT